MRMTVKPKKIWRDGLGGGACLGGERVQLVDVKRGEVLDREAILGHARRPELR